MVERGVGGRANPEVGGLGWTGIGKCSCVRFRVAEREGGTE